jgi:hypothetical protein
MLGDKLGQETGKVVLRRVIPSGAGAVRMEVSQRGHGTLLGVEYQDTSTYESELRPDGTLFGTGQGVYMGKGGEVGTWTGQGVGVMSPSGGVSFRGALYIYSTSPKWQRLNAVAAVFEYDVDPDDAFKGVLTEWK